MRTTAIPDRWQFYYRLASGGVRFEPAPPRVSACNGSATGKRLCVNCPAIERRGGGGMGRRGSAGSRYRVHARDCEARIDVYVACIIDQGFNPIESLCRLMTRLTWKPRCLPIVRTSWITGRRWISRGQARVRPQHRNRGRPSWPSEMTEFNP